MINRRELLKGLTSTVLIPFLPKNESVVATNDKKSEFVLSIDVASYVEYHFVFPKNEVEYFSEPGHWPYVIVPLYVNDQKSKYDGYYIPQSDIIFLNKKTPISIAKYLETKRVIRESNTPQAIIKVECSELDLFGYKVLDHDQFPFKKLPANLVSTKYSSHII